MRDIPTLIEYISEFMTLNPYDVILTGTPEGISHIYPGDELRVWRSTASAPSRAPSSLKSSPGSATARF